MLWTLRRPAAINTIVWYLVIDRCLLELVVSTDGGPSSGVSQTVTVQVCLRHRKPRTSEHAEEKTREHNLIYAAVNLNAREYNSTFCIIEANFWQSTKHRAASLRQQSYLSNLAAVPSLMFVVIILG